MDFTYSKQQELLRKTVREFVQKEVAPKAAEFDRTAKFDYSIPPKMGKMKLLGVMIPKEYGGQGASHIDAAIITEEVSRVSVAAAIIANLGWYVAYDLWKVGTEEQKKKYIPPLLRGEKLGAHAGSEANAGTDAASLTTTAKRDGDHYVLNGTKWFVSNIGAADYYMVTLYTTPGKRYTGVSNFLVEKGTAGMKFGRLVDLVGDRGLPNGELIFEDCRVPKDNLIGVENKGWYDLLRLYDAIRCYLAAMGVGAAEAAFDASLKFSKERQQFGKPIGDFQFIRGMLADMATDIDAARFLTYRALDCADKGLKHTKETSMAKLYAGEMAERVTSKAIHVHGGYGLTRDFPVERLWRDVKLFSIGEGTNEIQRLIIAANLFKSNRIVLDSALD